MRPIARRSRVTLGCMAVVAFAGALRVAPTTAQIRDPLPTAPATSAPNVARIAVVFPRRDPFAGGFAVVSPVGPRKSNETEASVASIPPIPAILAPLPPNAGASMSPLGTTSTERVSAVVTGSHPFALLEDGPTALLLSIGDDHDGRRISAIDQSGVHLNDGTLLKLSPNPSPGTPSLGGRGR
jgi:hypothetical protein